MIFQIIYLVLIPLSLNHFPPKISTIQTITYRLRYSMVLPMRTMQLAKCIYYIIMYTLIRCLISNSHTLLSDLILIMLSYFCYSTEDSNPLVITEVSMQTREGVGQWTSGDTVIPFFSFFFFLLFSIP